MLVVKPSYHDTKYLWTPYNELNWWQKIICDRFKIRPAQRYTLRIAMKLKYPDDVNQLKVGDVLNGGEITFRVVSIIGDVVELYTTDDHKFWSMDYKLPSEMRVIVRFLNF